MECKEVWSCTQVYRRVQDAARDSALSSIQLIKQFNICSSSTEIPRSRRQNRGKKKSARAEEDGRDESGRGREGELLEGGPRSARSKIGRYTGQHISINEFSGYRVYFRFSYRSSTYDSNPQSVSISS